MQEPTPTNAQESFSMDSDPNGDEQAHDERRSSLPDRRQSFFVPQGLNLASGTTPATFRRQFGPVDAAHGYHDLNFIAKEVRGIPELKEKEKITGWLAKISTHLDHMVGLPGFVYALESRLQNCPEALRAYEQGCSKPGYAAAREAGDYKGAFELVAREMRLVNAGQGKELSKRIWRQTKRQGHPRGQQQCHPDLTDTTREAAARFGKYAVENEQKRG